jgi:hypothetical protein
LAPLAEAIAITGKDGEIKELKLQDWCNAPIAVR